MSATFSELEVFVMTPPEKRQPKQVQAIEALGKLVDAVDLSPKCKIAYSKYREVFLLKYLFARKWNVDNAFQMVKDVAEHRKEKQMDFMPLYPSPIHVRGWTQDELMKVHCSEERKKSDVDNFFATFACCYSGAWHKTDKEGHPIFIERTGHIKVRQMVSLSKRLTPPGGDITWPSVCQHIHNNEVGGSILDKINYDRESQGKPAVHQCVIILDGTGCGLGHLFKPCLNLMKALSEYDQKYYPEGMSKVYVVNTPAMVSVAWSVIKPWLDSQTQKKIVFVKSAHTKAKLLEVIDAENLPEFLGGKCNCEGQCVPDVLPDTEVPDAVDGEDICVTEEIQVPRGKSVTKTYPIKDGETVFWDFATEKYDVSVRVSAGGAELDNLTRVGSGGNSIALPPGKGDGEIQFVFDNSYSWVHGKVVQLRISRSMGGMESPILQ